MNILGISAFYHDSAAAIICNGKIIAAAQEERFTRIKQDSNFPENAVKFCLEFSGLSISELDAVAFYDKPLLKFERLLETYYSNAPKGFQSFVTAMPVWIKEKLFLKKIIKDALSEVESYDKSKLKLVFPEHHLSHAASAFYPSHFKEAAILTIDGVGEWATSSICYGNGNQITVLKELHFPHSLGLLYSAFTYFLGFKVNSGEYKLMGLAPYGNLKSANTEKFIASIKDNLLEIKDDGSIILNMEYFNYQTGLTMVNSNQWKNIFGFERRTTDSIIEQHHADLALAIQTITNEVVLKMAIEAKKLTGSMNLCMAGGVALNCTSNSQVLKSGLFKEIFIQPAAGDAGGAVGAALAAHHIYYGAQRTVDHKNATDEMSGTYLGPEFSDLDVELVAKKHKAVFKKINLFDELATAVADLIAQGYVIGWMQGRMEFGPRALGNRSIIADARNTEMQKKLNLKIKYRESFRPFAPSVLDEDKSSYFEIDSDSPYMLFVADVKNKNTLPENYNELSQSDRLAVKRSEIPAVTHLDFSARIQTVHQDTNEKYWKLINKFKEKTGCSLIVNTSFNVRGEPIVCNPEDAYYCFMNTDMDYLVIGNYIFDKKDQPERNNKESFIKNLKPD